MKQQALEKVLTLIVDEHKNGTKDGPRMNGLVAKASILLDRDSNSQASVIRELINNQV